MSIRYDVAYEEALEQLKVVLDGGKKIAIGKYNQRGYIQGDIKHYVTTNIGDNIGYSNILLQLDYTLSEPTLTVKPITKEKQLDIILLNPSYDMEWNKVLLNKVWQGDYPSTVAFSPTDGAVYLVYIMSSYILFAYFGQLNNLDLEALENINYMKPYQISIHKQALWEVLSEEEGSHYLQKNVYIEFNCGRRVVVENLENELIPLEDTTEDEDLL